MTKVRRVVLGILFAFLMIEVIIIAPKEIGVSGRSDSPLSSQSDSSSDTQQTMKGVHLVESNADDRDWELWSDQADAVENGKLWKLTKVKAKFFGKENIIYTVTGDTGEVQVDTKDVVINGNVVMVSSNGYRFLTNHLNYKADEKVIFTADPITMKGSEAHPEQPMELTGIGLEASLISNSLNIKKAVRSKRTVKPGEIVVIESQTAEFSAASKFAKYLGDVTIDYKGSRITGPSARFDYDPTVKAFTSLLVEGGGRVTDLTKWATAKTIQMLFQDNKFILKGSPRVVQDNDEVVGDEIVFLDGGKEILVNRGKAEFTPGNGKE